MAFTNDGLRIGVDPDLEAAADALLGDDAEGVLTKPQENAIRRHELTFEPGVLGDVLDAGYHCEACRRKAQTVEDYDC